ncbi:hypothetical protein [Photobacterium damselae]|uniref:hypothetical protein n=1 Tax=Photobacterium damselae TaxID=38293 RepID=UPI001F1E2035|nr:hypothetical protein [Photobacterium damselae]UKA07762.1 hypothetical protein IHC90_17940 [Photobacterium damselae subsp. damselae]
MEKKNRINNYSDNSVGILSQTSGVGKNTNIKGNGFTIFMNNNESFGVESCSLHNQSRTCLSNTKQLNNIKLVKGSLSHIELNNSTINISGDNSYGVYSNGNGSSIDLNNLNLNVDKETSSGFALYNGNININNSHIESKGIGFISQGNSVVTINNSNINSKGNLINSSKGFTLNSNNSSINGNIKQKK